MKAGLKQSVATLTDEESRIMPVSGGGFEQTYNAQAAVDTKSKLIVTAHIIKAVMGFRGFMLRGKESATGEWNLACMAYNIKRMHALKPV